MHFSEPHAREVHLANLEQVGEELVGSGFATRGQLERCLAAMRDPNLSLLLPMLVSAWGRKAGPTGRQL